LFDAPFPVDPRRAPPSPLNTSMAADAAWSSQPTTSAPDSTRGLDDDHAAKA
jgi:hypothetical protein